MTRNWADSNELTETKGSSPFLSTCYPLGAPGLPRVTRLERVQRIILGEGKPLTVQKVIARLGDGYAEHASAILDRLVAWGVLAKFGAGFNNYYGSPREVLTGKEPTLGTVVLDSVKRLFPGLGINDKKTRLTEKKR